MDEQKKDVTVPTVNESKRGPSPITSTADDGPRKSVPTDPDDDRKKTDRQETPATATMPPESAGNPDRNTM